jgi:PIN domain nuclease of toxin-antitoxin system
LRLNITAADAIMAGGLPWAHRDPFDRMLVAQAARRGLVLASSDATLLAGALSPTLDTRE